MLVYISANVQKLASAAIEVMYCEVGCLTMYTAVECVTNLVVQCTIAAGVLPK